MEIRNERTFEEFKQAIITNLSPATSTRLYEKFEELNRIPWTESSNITAHMNQALAFLTIYCEETDARYGIKIEDKVQRLLLASMLYVKLPSKVLKVEVNKIFTANKNHNDINRRVNIENRAIKRRKIGQREGTC